MRVPQALIILTISFSYGLEGDKSGEDEGYKPRKWSQLEEGPYRMVVSSRGRPNPIPSTRVPLDQPPDDPPSAKEDNTDMNLNSSDVAQVAESDQETPVETSSLPVVEAEDYYHSVEKSRQTRIKELESIGEANKYDKSTQRALIKARKRLASDNSRKLSRVNDALSTTQNPHTLSYKMYHHFRPLDRGVPRESIIPFLDFGKKLSTGRTPSAINSIEGSSTAAFGGLGVTTEREDEDLFHEDMDVSVVKLKAVERNTVPRIRAPARASGITAYYRKRIPARTHEALVQASSPLPESPSSYSSSSPTPNSPPPTLPPSLPPTIPAVSVSEDTETITSNSSTVAPSPLSTSAITTETPPTAGSISLVTDKEPEVTTISTTAPTFDEADLQTNESRTNLHVMLPPEPTESPMLITTLSTSTISPELPLNVTSRSRHSNITTQVPRPSPTAKILSTAVVTSISVKETYRHPRIKPNLEARFNLTSGVIDLSDINATLSEESEDLLDSHGYENISTEVTKTTENPQPTTVRPKYNRSNLEYHASFTTKVPTTTMTHKPLNRSLYSTHQREHKSKLLTSQHKNENLTKVANKSEVAESRNVTLENKSKMYLTIRSRLANHSATYRSTFRRNSTKPVPPVLRVIATPSSYIEVPKILNRAKLRSNITLRSTTTVGPQSASTISTTLRTGKEINPDYEETTMETVTEINTQVSEPVEEEISFKFGLDPTTAEPELSTVIDFKPLGISSAPNESPTTKAPVPEMKVSTAAVPKKPGLTWIYAGQKNNSLLASDNVEVTYSASLGIATYVLAALGVVPLILGGFLLIRQLVIKSKKKMLDESEYSSEYNRTPLPAKLPRIPSHAKSWEEEKGGGGGSSAPSLPPPPLPSPPQPPASKWEFPRDKLRLQTLLGEGNFGQVWKAEADDISGHEGLTRLVAVKTVKEGASSREREDLLRELGIMQDLGSHPNVVTLLGCCTSHEPYLLIMEYVMYGKMLTFLREHRTKAHYFNFSDLASALTSRDLTVFSYCVARGMEYIVSKGIIHRDLAARNILVDHNKLCKIADFGMSRNVRDTGEIYEQRPNRGALPIRWMAPEALHYSLFTQKSDVWSFGILVWEIITLGSTPYSTMGAREVMRRVREGLRLERPEHCRSELFRVASRCWASDPTKRPTFTELKHELAGLLADPHTKGALVDLEALTEEMSSHSC